MELQHRVGGRISTWDEAVPLSIHRPNSEYVQPCVVHGAWSPSPRGAKEQMAKRILRYIQTRRWSLRRDGVTVDQSVDNQDTDSDADREHEETTCTHTALASASSLGHRIDTSSNQYKMTPRGRKEKWNAAIYAGRHT